MTREPRILRLWEMLCIILAIIIIGGGLLVCCPNPKGF